MRAGLQNVPPKIKSAAPPSLAIFTAAFFLTTIVGIGAIIFFFNPSTHGFYPVCQFHLLTGLNCPGCGMTRALYALLHGNLRPAVKDNFLFVVLLAVLAVLSVRFVFWKLKKQPATFNVPPKFLWTLLVIGILFAVVRNLPGFEWLSP